MDLSNMKAITALQFFVLYTSSTLAGKEFDQFSKDMASYLTEQNKNPNKIIRYSDQNGSYAKAVLKPERAKIVLAEVSEEIGSADKLGQLLDSYKPTAENYVKAFNQFPGKYDEEYLDSYEFMYLLLGASFKPLQSMNLNEISDENLRSMAQAAEKMASVIPALMLSGLEKQIADQKFLPEFTPRAQAVAERLRKYQAIAPQNPSR